MSDRPPPALPLPPAPGPRGLPVLGNLLAFRRDVLALVLDARRRFGDVVRFRLGPTTVVHLLCHPDHVRHVLVDHAENYDKATRSAARIQSITGPGLLTTNGDAWRRQRRLMQPAFAAGRVAGFVPMMADATAAVLERWADHARTGEPVDVASEMMRLTYTIVGRALFGSDVTGDVDAVERAAGVILSHTYRRLERLVDPPDWVPTPANRRFRRALGTVDRVVHRILAERAGGGNGTTDSGTADRDDLLSRLLDERDEATGSGMAGGQVRNEVITLLLAGHETTANALTWAFYLLSQHPAAADRVRDEARRVLGDRPPTAADLAGLDYTTRVIQEAMRLYPPIWVMERRALADDVVGGHPIPAGSSVVLCPWATHRQPDFWPDPETFDPDRFLSDRCDGRPPFAYFPFGGGPRYCIGAAFAMTEAKVILAMTARAYRLDLVPGFRVEPKPGITLRTQRGVRMTVRPAGPS